MLTIDVKLALLAAVPLPLISLLFIWVGQRHREALPRGADAVRQPRDVRARRTSPARASSRPTSRRRTRRRRSSGSCKVFERANIAWARLAMAIWPMLSVLIGLSTVIVIYVGAHWRCSPARSRSASSSQFNGYIVLLAHPDGQPRLDVQPCTSRRQRRWHRVEEVLARKPAGRRLRRRRSQFRPSAGASASSA